MLIASRQAIKGEDKELLAKRLSMIDQMTFNKNYFLKNFWKEHKDLVNKLWKEKENASLAKTPFRALFLQYLKKHLSEVQTPMSDAILNKFGDVEKQLAEMEIQQLTLAEFEHNLSKMFQGS